MRREWYGILAHCESAVPFCCFCIGNNITGILRADVDKRQILLLTCLHDCFSCSRIRIDKFMDDNSDDDTNRSGWEPTDNTSTENSVLSLMMIDDLINEVSLKYPEAKAIFSLLMDDPQISNALKQVDLKKGKSQAYEYVKKMQAYAKELYNKNYR